MALSVPQDSAAPRSEPAPPAALVAKTLASLREARAATHALVAHLDDATLERVLAPIMSPLVWDLAHIAAYEDLWLAHRHAGLPLLRPELAELYDAFETPRAVRGEVQLLDAPAARDYLSAVRARVEAALLARGIGDGVLCELVVRHELQHTETMRQALAIADLLPPGEPRVAPLPDTPLPDGATSPADAASPEDTAGTAGAGWVAIPTGAFQMGAPAEGFAYDNERPRHAVELAAFAIARHPVSNASWLRFSEGGGYERREWWSDEGWAWKEQFDITHHPAVAAGDPRAAVCHVSWFEADAFARAHGARLPSEAEWEKAATWRQGALAASGQVWEWTSSHFGGYPGFVAHPYREYSEVFFGERYRVLRGGSWATSPRVASATFRNWDLPQRRQIFAGVRLARDLAEGGVTAQAGDPEEAA
jgi:iron(II)-dependent oxidoreductase